MKRAVMALATAATVGVAALAPSPAHAWRGGWGPGLAGGLLAGAVIGGIASSAYAYGPGYTGTMAGTPQRMATAMPPRTTAVITVPGTAAWLSYPHMDTVPHTGTVIPAGDGDLARR